MPAPGASSPLRLGLRAKLALVSLLLTLVPLLVVWCLGLYEELSRRALTDQVREVGATLLAEVSQQNASLSDLAAHRAWLARYGATHHVMIQLIDGQGQLAFQTKALDADRWSALSGGWWRDTGDFFFGPQGPPELLAHEETLPPPGRRPEVRRALAGEAAERWRLAAQSNMAVFYRALPLSDGAIYLTRLSRRNILALHDLRYQLLKLTLILAALASLMGLWVGRRFVTPLVQLQRRIRAFVQNPAEIDPQQLGLRRGDEIGDLSRDFQQLTGALQGQLQRTGEMAADLAHDLKNPIATVAATAELVRDGKRFDADRRRRLSRAMADAADHMNRSVEGMHQLARLEQNLASATRRRVEVSALVDRLVTAYRSDPAAEQVTFESRIEPDIALYGLEDQLEQLVRNLIDNAILFCHSTVGVGLHQEEQRVLLSVNDDGPGISPGNGQLLFRRFFSVRPEGVTPGTGLGLAIALRIARSHGGDVDAQTKGSLSGANFVVSLPRD